MVSFPHKKKQFKNPPNIHKMQKYSDFMIFIFFIKFKHLQSLFFIKYVIALHIVVIYCNMFLVDMSSRSQHPSWRCSCKKLFCVSTSASESHSDEFGKTESRLLLNLIDVSFYAAGVSQVHKWSSGSLFRRQPCLSVGIRI